MTSCDEIISITSSVSTNVKDTRSKNVWILFQYILMSKKKRKKQIFISDNIAIYDRHYLLSLCKTNTKTKSVAH